MQDLDAYSPMELSHNNNTIQIDDILNITVGALMPEAALPYNKISPTMTMANSLDLIKLEGYLVSQDKTINFPVLGIVSVAGKTTIDFRKRPKRTLESWGIFDRSHRNGSIIKCQGHYFGRSKSSRNLYLYRKQHEFFTGPRFGGRFDH